MIVYLQHLSSVKVQYNNLGPNKSDFAAQKDKNSSKNRVLLPQIVVVSTQDASNFTSTSYPSSSPAPAWEAGEEPGYEVDFTSRPQSPRII